MKQKNGSKNCVAIVACMATGCTPEDVDKFLGYDTSEKGICDYDFYRFMLSRGYVIGIGIENGWNEGLPIIKSTVIWLEYKIEQFPAYVVVESKKNPENGHAIYWDGKKIWDPNPDVEDGLPLKEYIIYRWFPIIKVEDKTSENTKPQFTLEKESIG